MSARPNTSTPPSFERPELSKLCLQRKEAAEALAISVDHFDREVRPFVRVRRSGSLRLWPVAELQRWLDEGLEEPPNAGAER